LFQDKERIVAVRERDEEWETKLNAKVNRLQQICGDKDYFFKIDRIYLKMMLYCGGIRLVMN
jgi:hypothetical protein